jgi:hypothetical protein
MPDDIEYYIFDSDSENDLDDIGMFDDDLDRQESDA